MGLGGSMIADDTYLLFVTLPPGKSSEEYEQVTDSVSRVLGAPPEDASQQLTERVPPNYALKRTCAE